MAMMRNLLGKSLEVAQLVLLAFASIFLMPALLFGDLAERVERWGD